MADPHYIEWAKARGVIQRLLDSSRAKMDTAEEVKTLWQHQGAIRALKTVLNLPQIIELEKEDSDDE